MTINVNQEGGNYVVQIPRISTNATLAQVTAAGWLNGAIKEGFVIPASSKVLIAHDQGTGSAATDFFNISISNGVYTLSLSEADVILPVVSGHLPVFSGTAGAMADSGLTPSAASQVYAVVSPGSLTVGNIPFLNDANGTLNTGRAPSATNAGYKVVMSPGSLTAGNIPMLADVNGTVSNGLPPSAASQAYVVVSPGSLTVGNIPFLNDANGTLNTGREPSAATAGYKVVMSPGSLTAGNLVKLGDANGTIADQGVAMQTGIGMSLGGSATITITDAFCTVGSIVIGNWLQQANPASVLVITPGNGTFDVTSTADAGVGNFGYVIYK